MLTFEDVTKHFLESAAQIGLVAHPEYWLNSQTLEREFACTYHSGVCEDADKRSSCLLSFAWGPLDTVLSREGPVGICEFFHEPDANCLHLQTHEIPSLSLELSYTLPLQGQAVSEEALLSFMKMLRLHAGEHSQRTMETSPSMSMRLHENRLVADSLTLQQRVELPIWHPEGMRGLFEEPVVQAQEHVVRSVKRRDDGVEEVEIFVDNPRPEEWLPQVVLEVSQDVQRVLSALDSVRVMQHQDNVSDNQ
ncbi:hypothetical protein [Ktedonospora formicarum]|uniref:Uncharacterized protein n=1 Tax=Ktedonospora formicarum TaxID=2778364 RepID=A0A8J3HYR8_9CHLR|nr:hypothetical protein [Ktedonospora formicarum]GHO43590.1 hypothetical protein KSX_17530 [Ktedonospora formicarum]